MFVPKTALGNLIRWISKARMLALNGRKEVLVKKVTFIVSTLRPNETFIVWLLTYLTLFMDIEYLSDRIMVAVTALLVLASVLDSINEDLPKTSYIKGVDFWFLWHFGSMMQIILFHIFDILLRKI